MSREDGVKWMRCDKHQSAATTELSLGVHGKAVLPVQSMPRVWGIAFCCERKEPGGDLLRHVG